MGRDGLPSMVIGLSRRGYLESAVVFERLTKQVTSVVQILAHGGSRVVIEYRSLS